MTDPAENIPTGKHPRPIWMYIFWHLFKITR